VRIDDYNPKRVVRYQRTTWLMPSQKKVTAVAAASDAVSDASGIVKQTFREMVASARADFASIVHGVERVVSAGLSGIGMVLSFGLLGVAIAVGIAALLHVLRYGFFAYAPAIARHSRVWDGVIKVLGDTFVAIIDFILLLVAGLKRLFKGTSSSPSTSKIHYVKMINLSTAALRHDLLNYSVTCAGITGPVELVALATKLGVGEKLCPYLRATYPLGAPGKAVRTLLGWASPPSAPNGGNCVVAPGSPGWPCVIINCSVMAFDLLIVYAVLAIVGWSGFARTLSVALKLVQVAAKLVEVWFTLLLQLMSQAVYGVEYVADAAQHFDEEPPAYEETEGASLAKGSLESATGEPPAPKSALTTADGTKL
jgi:hypothetical protein